MKSQNQIIYAYEIARLILYTFFSNLILITFYLFFNIPINILSFPLSIILACLIWKKINHQVKRRDSTYILFIFMIILIMCTLISGSVYFSSADWDGNAYHKVATGLLKNGWNPLAESGDSFGHRYFGSDKATIYGIWIDHYGKASWIFAASLYFLTGNIECGKVYNLLAVIAGFGVLYYCLTIKLGYKKYSNAIIALLTVFNPVSIAQIFMYYNDGYLGNMLYILIAGLWMYLDHSIEIRKQGWSIIIPSMIVLGNIKFTGLLYGGLFCVLFWALSIYKEFKRESIVKHVKNAVYFAVIAVITIGYAGFSTYIQNWISHGNPVYPLAGEGNLNDAIMITNGPAGFEGKPNIYKLFYAVFGKTENLSYNLDKPLPTLKIPFTVSYNEYLQLGGTSDTRIGGFGILFSGILLMSMILIVICILKLVKEGQKKTACCFLANILLITILSITISESWWARYSPYFYLLVIIAMIITQYYCKIRNLKIFFLILATLLLINNILFLKGERYFLKTSYFIRQDFEKLENKKINVFARYPLSGMYFNLEDYNIDYTIVDVIDPNKGGTTYYDCLEYEMVE